MKKRRFGVAAAVLSCLTAAWSTGAVAGDPLVFYLKLDGRWYNVLNQDPSILFDGTGVRAPAGDLINCRRADGQAQVFSTFSFYYGPTFAPVYQVIEVRYVQGSEPGGLYYIELVTAPRNIICDREIPDPTPASVLIYAHGFE